MDVRILCLGALSRGPCSGYEIRKQFEDGPFSHFQEAGFGSIYPSLRKLTEEELVTCADQPQESRPDKKVYRITSKGRQVLFEAVNREPMPDRLRSDLMFILFFADLVTARQVDRVIANRIAQHRDTIRRLETGSGSVAPGPEFVRGLGLALHRAALDYLETHQHELVGALVPRDVAE